MDWNAVGALGEVVGALAVVLTLIYLSVQVRQNSAAIRSATRADIAKTQAEMNWRFAEHPSVSTTTYAYLRGEDLNKDAEVIATACISGALRTFENQYFSYIEGNFSKSIWDGYRNNIRFVVTTPNFREYWDDRKQIFSREFRTLVDKLREQTPA